MASKRDLPDYYEFAGVTYGMLLDRVAAEVPENEFIVFKDQMDIEDGGLGWLVTIDALTGEVLGEG